MAARVLFIGASGNIGAAVLEALVAAHPELLIEALVRSEQDSIFVKESYPKNISTSQGGLDDLVILEEKASQADIVINCAPDVPYAKGFASLLAGLSSSTSPKFFIQTSGAARIWDAPDGSTPGRVWDDIADFDSFPSLTTHAETDTQVFAAASATLHTAIVSPTFVVGRSPSRTHTAPITFPYILRTVRDVGGGFVSGEGKNMTGFVDNQVLAEIYVALVADALRIIKGGDVNAEVWGPRAYYFASSLELSFREFVEDYLLPSLKRCGGENLLRNDEIKEIAQEDLTAMVIGSLGGIEALWSRHIAEGFGTAMRVRASRAQKYLGVDVKGKGLPGLDDAVRATLRDL
ncbi:hypothetical protein QBC34DRAFT_461650 [Podospora aff. communis PSN243]|uniref:Semialdehyde dehydrogenase NAD-binding domain-containing protein n=1 Tax=Podospora aff. communis PSN243 TaxID=3040156 RepID=A0AAV9GQ05_9PEZI|nr:hypothetical protein QBC34DRAFT_461650 [Podospora aff. communis PSN243]